MTYLVDDKKYSFNYQELKEYYNKIIQISDDDFLKNLTEILHFTCFVSYLKELPNECTISDLGIIHEMIHLKLCIETSFMVESKDILLEQIRKQFKDLMKID